MRSGKNKRWPIKKLLCEGMKLIYCPKCHKEVPMLDDDEFRIYSDVHREVIRSIQKYRETHGVTLSEVPLSELRQPALQRYFELTGVMYEHQLFDHIWQHQVARFG